jgi:hypothetical protein
MKMAALHETTQHVQTVIQHQFQTPLLLLEALTSAGSGFSNRIGIDGHKRLASVGRELLHLLAVDAIYKSGGHRGKRYL